MKILKYISIICLFFTITSCDEDLLDETPKDFLSPNNSFTKSQDIQSALNHQYNRIRSYNGGKYWDYSYLHYGTDLAQYSRSETAYLGDYNSTLLPTSGIVSTYWSNYFRMIFNSNVILDRIEGITYQSQEEKEIHIAEAKFFRGYAYRCLVNLYGGVPIVEKETTSPRRDFVRASKEATLQFAINDLEEAAAVLPSVEGVSGEGKASNAAARHLLTELYLSLGDPDKAIAAATAVIDDPNIELMRTRFGSHSGEDGDPYWDLHQMDNQNRSSGNKEGIFVIQVDLSTAGGGAEDNYNYNNSNALSFERNYGPLYWLITTPEPESVNIQFGPTTQEGGRPVAFVTPTGHVTQTVWGNGNWDVDQRNNERNIQRDWVVNNPNSSWYGKKVSDFPQSWRDGLSAQDTMMYFLPYITKVTTKNDHPSFILLNEETGEVNSSAGITYHDWYLMRVAETYLLRAEAYLAKGQTQLAADDINEVRERSNALPITASDVDIDFILDERLRELNYEEPRRMTLSRLGLLVERTRKYNPYSGPTIQEYNNLFPIPFGEIERNTLEVLEQNPGY
ncbi:RagB/SusD family nutrient uptake outer membrane protein [Aureibaculum sp. A20]|uniref:RagB/SusD family nutrient uptake outer membrane protein n=1 Tax=Aureibaculum flavum TaxID=2795986 RepID=A0ABS0WVX1_9FLAO|nr:RagB/SusD family nutrient uptake outer membrane protein [Aureibaculum flavum]MBJ2176065.1 RagB/SusD family nutrient uptake outer membrane protein [Aureibaculum flavum]